MGDENDFLVVAMLADEVHMVFEPGIRDQIGALWLNFRTQALITMRIGNDDDGGTYGQRRKHSGSSRKNHSHNQSEEKPRSEMKWHHRKMLGYFACCFASSVRKAFSRSAT